MKLICAATDLSDLEDIARDTLSIGHHVDPIKARAQVSFLQELLQKAFDLGHKAGRMESR